MITLTLEDRCARRQARRELQRERNVGRAQRMHEARLAYEQENGSSSPAAPPKPGVHVGCSGWFYWHWRDCFYPAGTPTNAWFQHYASQFRTVELNAPFYAWPTVVP